MAGQEIGALFVRIGADVTGLKAGLTEGAAEVDTFSGKINSGIASLAKFGAALAAIAVVTVAAGLYEAAKAASNFQASMRLIQTQAGASAAEVTNMSAAVLGLAGQVATSPEELAKGLYHLESAGFRGAKALEALKVAAEGAKVGQANLEDVTNALDAVLVAGVPEANNMAGAMGELNAIVGAGDMKMQDLADAMGTGILATAKTFGLGLQDVGAALAVFGDNNIRGSFAATKLRMAISLMGAPSAAAAKALKTIGISSTQLGMDLREGGLPKALADLKKHLESTFGDSAKGLSQQAEVLARAFGGGKSAGAIMLLMQQLDRLKTKEAEVGTGAGALGAAWDATTQNLNFKVDAAKAAFEAFGIKIGTKLLPPLTQLLDYLTPMIPKLADTGSALLDKVLPPTEQFAHWLTTLGPDLKSAYNIFKTLTPYLVTIGAAWVIWNVALAVTKGIEMATLAIQFVAGLYSIISTVGLATAAQWLWNIAMDANPVGIVIGALALLAAGIVYLYNNWKPFREFVNAAWDDLKKFGAWLKDHLWPVLQQIGAAIALAGGDLAALGGDLHKAHVPGFATGGIVPGAIGAPTLAIVHGGERVLTPTQQQQGATGGNTYVMGGGGSRYVVNTHDLLAALYTLMQEAQYARGRGASGSFAGV